MEISLFLFVFFMCVCVGCVINYDFSHKSENIKIFGGSFLWFKTIQLRENEAFSTRLGCK